MRRLVGAAATGGGGSDRRGPSETRGGAGLWTPSGGGLPTLTASQSRLTAWTRDPDRTTTPPRHATPTNEPPPALRTHVRVSPTPPPSPGPGATQRDRTESWQRQGTLRHLRYIRTMAHGAARSLPEGINTLLAIAWCQQARPTSPTSVRNDATRSRDGDISLLYSRGSLGPPSLASPGAVFSCTAGVTEVTGYLPRVLAAVAGPTTLKGRQGRGLPSST